MDDSVDKGEINELFDVDVHTVGLVRSGANFERFYLLKSTEGANNIAETVQATHDAEMQETDQPEVEKSLWSRLTTALRQLVRQEVVKAQTNPADNQADEPADDDAQDEKEVEEEVEEEQEAGDITTKSTPALSIMTTNAHPIVDDPVVNTSKSAAETTALAGQSASHGEVTTVKSVGLSPRSNVMPDTVDIEKAELVTKLEAIAKANAELTERVEKAEREAAVEKESRERSIYFQKASEINALPVSTTELADHMYWLRKSDAKRADWFEAVLKAVDSQLRTSELFVEKGTTRTPTEATLIEKAETLVKSGKAATLREALLSMDPAEQARYVMGRQHESK
jgi:hypothetical protein